MIQTTTSAGIAQNPMLSAALSTEDGNKLIAEFMGYKFGYPIENDIRDFNYHSSWELLMPVVDKIEEEEYPIAADPQKGGAWPTVDIINKSEVEITLKDESIVFIDSFKSEGSKIKAVWFSVVEFIKWHNENQGVSTGSR